MLFEDHLESELLRKGNAEFNAFLTDLATEPRPAEIVRKGRKELEAEKAEETFRQFQDSCEVESARTNIHERLRSERTEPGEPFEKAVLGELPVEVGSISFRAGRAELPLAKAEGGVGNRGGQAPPRWRFERPADADEVGAWFPDDGVENIDKGLNLTPLVRKEPKVELELLK